MKRLIFLLLLSPYILLAQSGWVKAPHAWYAQASVSALASKNYYTLTGEKLITNKFQQYALNLYGEYGIVKGFTAIANVSALRLNKFSTTDAVVAPGDLHLGLKYGILQGKFPLAISVASEIPLSAQPNFATANQPDDLGIRERINLATTDGEVNFWATLALSHSFGKAYASVYSAYNLRTSGFTDQIKGGIELGYQPLSRFWVIGKLNALSSVSNTTNPNVSFIRGEGTTYTAHSLAASYEFADGLGISAEVFSYSDLIVERKNLYSAPAFSVGIFLKHE